MYYHKPLSRHISFMSLFHNHLRYHCRPIVLVTNVICFIDKTDIKIFYLILSQLFFLYSSHVLYWLHLVRFSPFSPPPPPPAQSWHLFLTYSYFLHVSPLLFTSLGVTIIGSFHHSYGQYFTVSFTTPTAYIHIPPPLLRPLFHLVHCVQFLNCWFQFRQ